MLAARSPPRPAAFLQPVAGRGPGAAARPSPTDRRRSPAAAPPVAGRSLPFDWSLPARGGSPPAAGRSPPLSRPPRAGRHLSSRGRHRGAGLSPAVTNGSPAGPAGVPPLAAGSPTQLGASSLKTTATVSLGTQRRRSVWRFWRWQAERAWRPRAGRPRSRPQSRRGRETCSRGAVADKAEAVATARGSSRGGLFCRVRGGRNLRHRPARPRTAPQSGAARASGLQTRGPASAPKAAAHQAAGEGVLETMPPDK